MWACWTGDYGVGNVEIVRTLLEYGADVNAKNNVRNHMMINDDDNVDDDDDDDDDDDAKDFVKLK
jgi:ankyrin repeat protein